MVQAVGVRIDLRGPRPVAPRYSLLNTPGVVVEREGGRWMNGAVVENPSCDAPLAWEPCSEGTFREKGEQSIPDGATFDPFVVYTTLVCSSMGGRDLEEQARELLEATESAGVEAALADGIGDNPFFSDGNATSVSGTGATAALDALLNVMLDSGRAFQIHTSPLIVEQLNREGSTVHAEGGGLFTTSGFQIIAGAGYHDTGGASGLDDQHLYGVFGVEVRLAPWVITDIRSSLDRSNNELVIRAERYVLATFDTCLYADAGS